MLHTIKRSAALALAGALGLANCALAATPLRIGLEIPMSGPFADFGKQIDHGVQLYLAQHHGMIDGRQVQIVLKDDAPGTAGDIARRIAQELVIKDKVDILAGFAMTPAAFAVAPIATQAKIPMVVMNAATSSITTKSPYIVRTSMTLSENAAIMGRWAAGHGMHRAYVMVANFGPGYDAEAHFIAAYKAAGGTIVGDTRAPLNSPDYAPYLQRIEATHPDAVFLFMPGEGSLAFIREFHRAGLQKHIQLIGSGDLTDEDTLNTLGKNGVGIITAMQYSEDHDSALNHAYVQAYYKAYPKDRPNFMSVGGYDGMHLIDLALAKDHGNTSGPAFIAAAKGLHWMSPRGPISIDPLTRDIVQTIYIRKVEWVKGKLQNVEIDKFADVHDPGKKG